MRGTRVTRRNHECTVCFCKTARLGSKRSPVEMEKHAIRGTCISRESLGQNVWLNTINIVDSNTT